MNNSNKKPWTTGEKALLIAIVGIVLIAVSFGGFLHWRDAEPVVAIPTPAMPSPNAFDFYVAAGDAVKGDKDIGYAVSRHPAPGQRVYSQAEKNALVSSNADALKTLRRGFDYPYVNPPARSFAALFPYYAKERGLARLLSLEGQTQEARGDWRGASHSYLDAVQIGEEIPHGSVLIGMLVGIACQAIGRRPMWDAVNHLDASASKAAAKRLEKITARHFSYADTLTEEKWAWQAGLMEVFQKPNWRGEFGALSGEETDTNQKETRQTSTLMLTFVSKRKAMDDYAQWMDKEISEARRPYAAHGPERKIPKNYILLILLPETRTAWLKDVEGSQTQNALLMVTLALRAYKLEHGAYPASLSALTPGYLKTIPADPFALSGPLKYKKTASSYVLYSIGPDGKDDGGKAIFDASKSAPRVGATNDQRRYVNAESIGDVVAGVNVY